MGRTMPTHRMAIELLAEELRPYARTLRRVDQHALIALLDSARQRAAASSMLPDLTPLETALLSMLVEHQVALEQLQLGLRRMTKQETTSQGWEQGYKEQLAQHHGVEAP